MLRSRPVQVVLRAVLLVALSVLLAACFSGSGYGGSVDGPAAPGGDGTVQNWSTGAYS